MNINERIDKAISELFNISAFFAEIKNLLHESETKMKLEKPSEFTERLFESLSRRADARQQNVDLQLKSVDPVEKEQKNMLIDIPGICINSKPRKDGRFQGYVIKEKERYYFYGKDQNAVREKISKFIKTFSIKKKKTNLKPRLSEWLEKWLTLYKKPNVKPLTYMSLCDAAKVLNKAFGKVRINDISADDLQTFLIKIKSTRKRDVVLSTLRQALEKARKQGIIKLNPCESVEIKAHAYKHRAALTLEEQSRLIEIVKGRSIEDIFFFMLSTGLRVGEALALTNNDFDFEKKTVSVNKNVIFISGKRILQDTPKTSAGVRTVPVPDRVLDMAKTRNGIIFNMTYNAVRLSFARLAKETGIAVTAHILRHTYATRLEESGISPKVKQYLLGHSKIEMTQNTYTDIQKSYIDTLSEKIRDIFNK